MSKLNEFPMVFLIFSFKQRCDSEEVIVLLGLVVFCGNVYLPAFYDCIKHQGVTSLRTNGIR